jgi:hypothetical protein
MALVIEDGSIVANANTFITDEEFTAYADARGYTYPATAADREPLIIKAVDYLTSVENKMQGYRTDPVNQELCYPRRDVLIYCTRIGSDAIPKTLKNAQCEAAIALNDSDLLVTKSTQNIASETVGELSVSYHGGGSFEQVRTETIDVYLDPLLVNGGNNNMMSRW